MDLYRTSRKVRRGASAGDGLALHRRRMDALDRATRLTRRALRTIPRTVAVGSIAELAGLFDEEAARG